MSTPFGKNEWSALFAAIGLSEAQMRHWHQLFETRHPQQHERFLRWLGLAEAEIAQLRAASAAPQDE